MFLSNLQVLYEGWYDTHVDTTIFLAVVNCKHGLALSEEIEIEKLGLPSRSEEKWRTEADDVIETDA